MQFGDDDDPEFLRIVRQLKSCTNYTKIQRQKKLPLIASTPEEEFSSKSKTTSYQKVDSSRNTGSLETNAIEEKQSIARNFILETDSVSDKEQRETTISTLANDFVHQKNWIPNPQVPISTAEQIINNSLFENRKLNSLMESKEHLVQKTVEASVIVLVDELPPQSTCVTYKHIAHQTFVKMPHRVTSKKKQSKYPKAWKFKFKNMNLKRSKSIMHPHQLIDRRNLMYTYPYSSATIRLVKKTSTIQSLIMRKQAHMSRLMCQLMMRWVSRGIKQLINDDVRSQLWHIEYGLVAMVRDSRDGVIPMIMTHQRLHVEDCVSLLIKCNSGDNMASHVERNVMSLCIINGGMKHTFLCDMKSREEADIQHEASKFQLKHKWKSKILKSVSELELCLVILESQNLQDMTQFIYANCELVPWIQDREVLWEISREMVDHPVLQAVFDRMELHHIPFHIQIDKSIIVLNIKVTTVKGVVEMSQILCVIREGRIEPNIRRTISLVGSKEGWSFMDNLEMHHYLDNQFEALVLWTCLTIPATPWFLIEDLKQQFSQLQSEHIRESRQVVEAEYEEQHKHRGRITVLSRYLLGSGDFSIHVISAEYWSKKQSFGTVKFHVWHRWKYKAEMVSGLKFVGGLYWSDRNIWVTTPRKRKFRKNWWFKYKKHIWICEAALQFWGKNNYELNKVSEFLWCERVLFHFITVPCSNAKVGFMKKMKPLMSLNMMKQSHMTRLTYMWMRHALQNLKQFTLGEVKSLMQIQAVFEHVLQRQYLGRLYKGVWQVAVTYCIVGGTRNNSLLHSLRTSCLQMGEYC